MDKDDNEKSRDVTELPGEKVKKVTRSLSQFRRREKYFSPREIERDSENFEITYSLESCQRALKMIFPRAE